MDIYQLHLISTANPRWLSIEHRGRVAVDDNQVTLDGERLEIVGVQRSRRRQAVTVASGTLLEVWQHSNGMFVGAKAEDVDDARAAKAAREEAARVALRESEERLRTQALTFNASLAIPVRWVPGIVADASGIRLAVTTHEVLDHAVHVLLRQPLCHGRLRRAAGDLLCKSLGRADGKHLSAQGLDEHVVVTCPACITTAKRWESK